MGIAYVCNGCGRTFAEEELSKVRVQKATLPGLAARLGSKQDETTEGELCAECSSRLHAFVGEKEQVQLPSQQPELTTA